MTHAISQPLCTFVCHTPKKNLDNVGQFISPQFVRATVDLDVLESQINKLGGDIENYAIEFTDRGFVQKSNSYESEFVIKMFDPDCHTLKNKVQYVLEGWRKMAKQ